MTDFIVMTAEEAKIAKTGTVGQDRLVLRPIKLADGVRYVLPVSLLTDPDFADVHDQLAAFPIASVAPTEFPQLTGP